MAHSISIDQKEKWFENFSRYGLVSKGVVYCLIGVLSVMAALGLGGKEANKTEAFKTIYDQPFGKILLVVIALGLLGYVTLRFFQCFKDIDNKGSDAKGIAKRIGYGLSALIYSGLAVYAIKLVVQGPGTGGDSRQFMVSKALEFAAGQWLIGAAALIIMGSGVQQIYRAVTGKFMKRIRLVNSKYADVLKKSGVIGYISRGIVLLIIGYFLFHAAIAANPQEAQGTDQAFNFLENNFGSLMMGIVALGMVGYGVFMFVKARYQHIEINL